MKHPIVLDITHLEARHHVRPHTGIDRVDIAFADLVSRNQTAEVLGLHCGVLGPRLVRAEQIRSLVEASTDGCVQRDQDARVMDTVRRWMGGQGTASTLATSSDSDARTDSLRFLLQQARLVLHLNGPLSIRRESIYLNVAPSATPVGFYRWLERRPDVKAIFFIHDLLPLDHPGFFPRDWMPHYRRMLAFVLARGNGFIVASSATRKRLERELSLLSRKGTPIAVVPLPPADSLSQPPAVDPALQCRPYFVMSGTLEPRKNHLLVLQVWEKLLEGSFDPPARLVLVGKRGWLYGEILAALDRSRTLREHVLQFGGASDTVQHWLLSNALGALVPSHDEGYGLPLVEALALGLPTIASDIPVFREISQGCATYCNAHAPLDWLRMVSSLHDRSSAAWQSAARRAGAFRRPTVAAFTSAVTAFLESL